MRTAILIYDRLALFELGCAVELFALPRPEFEDWYETDVVTFDDKPLSATGNILINAKQVFSLVAYDMLVIPSWPVNDPSVSEALSQAITDFVSNGGRLISFCSGAFLLAEMGLLHGRTATTHWLYAERFKQRYPSVHYSDDVLYVFDQAIGCSAGSAAAIDLGLEVIRRDFGHAVANSVARRMILAAHRDGGQSQFVETPVMPSNSHFAATLDWAIEHLGDAISINALAARACMSRRTFDRKFRSVMNMSPKEWLSQQRVFLAKQLLETSSRSIENIAQISGFKTSLNMRNNFKDQINISPSQYRRQFGLNVV